MIKHIVLFKFKNPEENATKIETIKIELEALIDTVPTLKSIEVGTNGNPAEQYHLALTTTFETMDDLQAYAIHPQHVEVGKKIREILEARACVDYKF